MTTPESHAAVAVEDVRARFMDAERVLETAATRLEEMAGTLATLEESVDSVKGAGRSIDAVQEQVSESVGLLRSACQALVRAADELGQSDPRQLRTELATNMTQVHNRLDAMGVATERTRQELGARYDEGLQVTRATHNAVEVGFAALAPQVDGATERVMSGLREVVDAQSRHSRVLQREVRVLGVAVLLVSVAALVLGLIR